MNEQLENKVSILAELWMNYRDEEAFNDFMAYNDIGLPLAYVLHNDLVIPTAQAEIYIDETYKLLLAALSAQDKPYTSLDDLLSQSGNIED